VNQTALENQFNIYPNPVQDKLYVDIGTQINSRISYQIMDISGRIISHGEIEKGVNMISVEHLPSALYFIQFQTEKEKISLKFVKN
jgi:hypothetical protein